MIQLKIKHFLSFFLSFFLSDFLFCSALFVALLSCFLLFGLSFLPTFFLLFFSFFFRFIYVNSRSCSTAFFLFLLRCRYRLLEKVRELINVLSLTVICVSLLHVFELFVCLSVYLRLWKTVFMYMA